MSKIQKMFVEFKSIFVSEDLLKENEEHANIVTATTMFNIFGLAVIALILTYFNVFKIGMEIMDGILRNCVALLLIPSLICFFIKGKGKWIKHLLFISFILFLSLADAFLKYNVTLIMVLPIFLAARYYNKKFTLATALVTGIVFVISTVLSLKVGQQDLNTYNLIIPAGTTITINNTLRESVTSINVDEHERLKNVFIHFLLPKFMIYNILVFACIQIAQSGKKIIEKQKEISQKNERIRTELDLANAIQQNILPTIFPPFPEHKEIDIYASMTPAKEVGGDFYDMFLLDDSHLAICMADVSGKGVPASLIMMISKILIKNVSKIDREVDKVFNRVNNMLCEKNDMGLFVTCWFGILNLESGDLEFVNAGHNPPLLYKIANGSYEYLKTKPNIVLAGMENTTYTKHITKIEPGDRLFLYTDGVVEATNTDNKLYGEERLIKLLNNNLELDSISTIKEVKKDLDQFSKNAEQFDDITMLALIYKGKTDSTKSEKAQKEFSAKQEELTNVHAFVEDELEKHNIKSSEINQVNLAVEEIFVNIANYAYQGKDGTCKLSIEFKNPKELELTFEDNGTPFNPLENKDPDISLSADERDIGGLGIFITKKIMDDVTYKYESNKNILIMKKLF